MKCLINLSILCFLTLNLFTQNYQCVVENEEHLFSNGTDYKAVKIDSVSYLPDFTSYFNFTILGFNNTSPPNCYSPDHPTWFGKQVDIYSNGNHVFYNLDNEPILIQSAALLGEGWNCYTFYEGDYIRCMVTAVEEQEFLGLTDSVKTISFQAYDYYGNPISHQVNSKQLQLSKNNGFIKALNFKLFPELEESYPSFEVFEEYDLCGISNPEVGVQNLTIKDIFDFEIGDEFHIYDYSTSISMGGHHYHEIHRVLDKHWLSDTVVSYDFERCIKRKVYDYNWDDTTYFEHDTLSENINLLSFIDAGLNEVPETLIENNYGWSSLHWYYQSNGSLGKTTKYYYGGFAYDPGDDCAYEIIDYYFDSYFIEGLGGSYWHYWDQAYENYRKLQYYKKGDEVWGTPYNCDSLLTSVPVPQINTGNVSIAPNPMQRSTNIYLENLNNGFTFMLIDSFGRQIQIVESHGPELTFNRKNLPSGIYFYNIISEDKMIRSGKLILQ